MADSRIFILAAIFGAVVTAAQAQGVGVTRITVAGGSAKISGILWTPCVKPAQNLDIASPLPVRGVKDCPIEGGNLPMIVISHGLSGTMVAHHDTAEALAAAGFVVVTFNHVLDSGMDMRRADDIVSMIQRPDDVKRVVDFMLGASPAAAKIDPRRIGFFGFSRGGYTGLVLAGAEPDFKRGLADCPDSYLMCKQAHQGAIPARPPGRDPRIKAFVIADPINAFPDRKNLAQVSAPIQLWSSATGGQGVEPKQVRAIADGLPTRPEYHPVANSTHLSFLFPCTPAVAKVAGEACVDPPGFDRTAFHKDFDAQVVAFFRKNLGG